MKTLTKDLRTIKSEHNIRESLLTLIQNKPLKEITVNEICAGAQCGRNTFYLHYLDKYDLFEKICDECIEEMQKAFQIDTKKLEEITIDVMLGYSESVIEAVDKKKFEFRSLLSSDYSNYLQSKMKEILISECLELIRPLAPEKVDNPPYILYIRYIISGMLEFVFYWIASTDLSKDEALSILKKIHTNAVNTSVSYLQTGNI